MTFGRLLVDSTGSLPRCNSASRPNSDQIFHFPEKETPPGAAHSASEFLLSSSILATISCYGRRSEYSPRSISSIIVLPSSSVGNKAQNPSPWSGKSLASNSEPPFKLTANTCHRVAGAIMRRKAGKERFRLAKAREPWGLRHVSGRHRLALMRSSSPSFRASARQAKGRWGVGVS